VKIFRRKHVCHQLTQIDAYHIACDSCGEVGCLADPCPWADALEYLVRQ
jgi:hypothetical protein